MTNLADTLHTLIELLDKNSIPYGVMGGVAVRAYGVPRPTYDIDITIDIERNSLAKLFEKLRAIDYSIPEAYENGWVDEVKGLALLKLRRYVRDESLDVDLFLSESDFQIEAMKRRCRADVEGRMIWLISPEDLILFKLLAGRPHDLGDVFDVLFMQGQLDVEYM
jgi:predicted nucleotidyltransferase